MGGGGAIAVLKRAEGVPPETDLRAGEGAARAHARQGHEPGLEGPRGVRGEVRGLRLVGLGEGCVELGFDSR